MGYLMGLQYAMAGDMESALLVEQLMVRWREISWDDPAFIAVSREMQTQGGLPLGSDEESAIGLRSMAYALIQKNAELSEMMQRTLPLLDRLKEVTEQHREMRDHLEMLGADTTPYAL
jgi:hypothetical protein